MPWTPSGSGVGIALLLFSLCCLGTWPAMLDLCGVLGRHPAHSYLDYSIAIFMTCCVLAFTLGHVGEASPQHPSFPAQLSQNNWPLALVALIGGCLLMLGNLSMQRSLLLGVPLAIVLPLQASMTVVLGTSANYFLQPGSNDPYLLFSGVAANVIAILISSLAHVLDTRDKRRGSAINSTISPGTVSQPYVPCDVTPCGDRDSYVSQAGSYEPSFVGHDYTTHGSCESCLGLIVAGLGGIAFGGFSPAFNVAVNDQFGWLAPGVPPLTPWTANFYFDLSFVLSACLANVALMKYPLSQSRPSTFKLYVKDSSSSRVLALGSGVVCCLGNTAQFLGGTAAGFASSDLVQAFPLVGTIWGVMLFGEFRGSSRRVIALVVFMYVIYITAVVLVATSVR